MLNFPGTTIESFWFQENYNERARRGTKIIWWKSRKETIRWDEKYIYTWRRTRAEHKGQVDIIFERKLKYLHDVHRKGTGMSEEEKKRIKEAILAAKSLEEVEILQQQLQMGTFQLFYYLLIFFVL